MMTEGTWTCPSCGRRFRKPNQQHVCERHSVQEHLERATPRARDLYRALFEVAAQCGEFFEEATKTAIALKTPGLFMSVSFKQNALNCSIWLPEPLHHPRIRHNYPIGNLYAVHFQIRDQSELNTELKNWLCRAYYFLEAA